MMNMTIGFTIFASSMPNLNQSRFSGCSTSEKTKEKNRKIPAMISDHSRTGPSPSNGNSPITRKTTKKTRPNGATAASNGKAASSGATNSSSSGSSSGKKSKEEKRREAELRNQLYRALQKGEKLDAATLPNELLRPAIERVENTIAKKEEEKDTLEVKMADPDLYNRPDEFSATMDAFAEAEQELKRLYEQWESLAARAEEVGA